ncbi:MAG: protein kinase, partial [Polyangiaceae bacterium]|nr:protein kinase [Polyangiaceae bacterium]
MENETLRGELERLFDLEEMIDLSQNVLGMSPDDVGGTASKASFARALVDRCFDVDAADALLDAVAVVKPNADRRVLSSVRLGMGAQDELQGGSMFGAYRVVRKLGSGPSGVVYLAQRDGHDHVLKVLAPRAIRDHGSFARFAATVRLVARLQHEGLPAGLAVGQQEGLRYVVFRHVDGQTVAARIARSGPLHINEAWSSLRGVLDALAVLHDSRIAHGNIKPENVLLGRGTEVGKHRVVLVDAGYDRLRALRAHGGPGADVLLVLGGARSSSPEQLRGQAPDTRADAYGFGTLMYEMLTGKPMFQANNGVSMAIAQLSSEPEPPATAAPRGWASKEVSDFVLRLVARDPSSRPEHARAILEAFETLGRAAVRDKAQEPSISEADVGERIDALVVAPDDEAAAAALDDAVEKGGDPNKIAQAFVMASDQLAEANSSAVDGRKSLLFRAARLYESNLKAMSEAERIYARITTIDPNDDIADAALEEVRRRLGRHEEVIEMLLARIERTVDSDERAAVMAEIGRLYATELEDPGQAVVAYAQAFTEAPEHGEYADAIEQVAGADVAVLGEAISMMAEATRGELPSDLKNKVFLRLGQWYGKRLGRSDAALTCYKAVIATDPSNDSALEGMADLFRSTQQHGELGQVLMRRAEATLSAKRAREFRVEAAELLDNRLAEPAKAKELFEQVVAADPAHQRASEALLQIYEKEGNYAGVVKLLQRKAETVHGRERAEVLVRVARIQETYFKDVSEAARSFEAALGADPHTHDALSALDRLYTRSNQSKDLLRTLDRQLEVADTPRQKITILERIATIHAEEFLDHVAASGAYERVLAIDPSNNSAFERLAIHYRALDKWSDVASVYERQLRVTTAEAARLDILLALARVAAERLSDNPRAMRVYEEVLEIDPGHSCALEALAALREQSGDAQAALEAIEALAQKVGAPREKAEHYIRAAKLLEERDDVQGAIERYRKALDVSPGEAAATTALRRLYLERGEVASALELISKQTRYAESPSAKAKLCAEAAKLARDKLRDNTRAEIYAKQALEHDPNQVDALTLLGDLAFANDRPVEALHRYEPAVQRIDQLPKAWAIVALRRYVEALVKTDQSARALTAAEQLLEVGKDDLAASMLGGRVVFEHGDARRSLQLHKELLDRFGESLVDSDRALMLYRYGESARLGGDAVAAVKALTEAADLDPTAAAPLNALARVHEAKGEWEEVIRSKNRRLDVAASDERVELLVEVGEICTSKLKDRTRAAKSFIAALEERPDDRKLLTRLMQLYSEAKDWSKLVEVVLKLADFVQDPMQKAKYVHTAAIVTGRQLNDEDKALEYLEKAMTLDPGMDAALNESIELRVQKADWQGVEKLLKLRLERASEAEDRELVLKTFDALGELYQNKLGWTNEAIDAYEAAQMLDPDKMERNGLLAELYVSNPAEYLDKAVASQRALLSTNPNRAEPYKLLRRLYTESKRADCAWCLCQALT